MALEWKQYREAQTYDAIEVTEENIDEIAELITARTRTVGYRPAKVVHLKKPDEWGRTALIQLGAQPGLINTVRIGHYVIYTQRDWDGDYGMLWHLSTSSPKSFRERYVRLPPRQWTRSR